MGNNGSGLTASDVLAITNNEGGFGGNGGALWLIIILALLWGNGWNNGFGGVGAGGVSENYTLISDMGQLERKIDGVYSGICDSTFALNNTATNGFASVQNTLTQGFAGLNTGIVQHGYETRIGVQNLGAQMAQCLTNFCNTIKSLVAKKAIGTCMV